MNKQKNQEPTAKLVETQKTRLGGFVALALLLAFFTPYVLKVSQIDIAVILLGGMALAVADFLIPEKKD
ncbi:MAG: hypothetical protein RL483_1112 [Pseudomonadota bacterium]|jgi:hypothetical protein